METIREYARSVQSVDVTNVDEATAAELGHPARLEIHSVDERFGADIGGPGNVCTDDDGEVVLEAFTTPMGQQADQTVKISGR